MTEIPYGASPAVLAALGRLGRTEDVRFSPSNRRLAIASFDGNSIWIADVEIATDGGRPRVTVTDIAEVSSPRLSSPHGLDFLDDETIIVANRFGEVTVFRLPPQGAGDQPAALTSIDLQPGRGFGNLDAPGALTVSRQADGGTEVLVCNNQGGTVTRHVLDTGGSATPAVTANDVLLRQGLAFPNAVAVSPDGAWIAVSNHARRRVMLYERSSSPNERSDPDGILRGPANPHGVRFSADGGALFVADAETPFVHVYSRDGDSWRGVQCHPAQFVRVIEDDVFQREHRTGEGGPKGIDIDRRGCVLVATCESRPLAFFDVAAILERGTGQVDDRARQVRDELWILEQERLVDARYEGRIAALRRSTSYRITKPLRGVKATWTRVRG